MPEASLHIANDFILYEDGLTPRPRLEWVQPGHWRDQGALGEALGGRGQVWSVRTPVGPAVLRRYQRGGWVRGISRDQYVYLGVARSRAVREFRLLEHLRRLQLPVPGPIMASCECGTGVSAWQYRCGLLTREIPGAETLASLAPDLGSQDWKAIGHTLGRFFKVGLQHPDLNASNLVCSNLVRSNLVGSDLVGDGNQHGDQQWWLLDLDKAHCGSRPSRPQPMLKRLQRSLNKQRQRADESALWAGVAQGMDSKP